MLTSYNHNYVYNVWNQPLIQFNPILFLENKNDINRWIGFIKKSFHHSQPVRVEAEETCEKLDP